MNAWKLWGQLSAGLLVAAVCLLPAAADELVFYPTDDTYVDEYGPNSVNGALPTMSVRNTGYGPWERDALVKFDISSIPPGTDIPSATLHLYYWYWDDNNPAGRPLTCYRVTSDWNEETVAWSSRPGHAAEVTSSTAVPSSYQWMEWDVTADVQAFVNGSATNYGWTVLDETYWPGGGVPIMDFRTKEYGQLIPYLAVVPEPGSLGLLLLGSLRLLGRRR